MLTKEEFEKNFYESELIEEAEEGDKLVWIPEAKTVKTDATTTF